jgi:hypothetical protein
MTRPAGQGTWALVHQPRARPGGPGIRALRQAALATTGCAKRKRARAPDRMGR